MSSNSESSRRIIACAVFKSAIEHMRLVEIYTDLRITYLPSKLHLKPLELKKRLLKEVVAAHRRGERVICLYGECFPDIDLFCEEHGVKRVPGHYCYEMLLGNQRFGQLIDEIKGTYFAEKDLIQNFEEYCMRPLELHDQEMRRYCFENYTRLLYVRQPSDPNLVNRAGELAEFLGMSLEIDEADYSHLENEILNLIELGRSQKADPSESTESDI